MRCLAEGPLELTDEVRPRHQGNPGEGVDVEVLAVPAVDGVPGTEQPPVAVFLRGGHGATVRVGPGVGDDSALSEKRGRGRGPSVDPDNEPRKEPEPC